MKSFFKPLKNKYFWKIVGGLSLWLLLVTIACNVQVNRKTAKALYDDLNLVPACEVGLLLGTNPYLKNGLPNKYFLYRIEAAVQLYQAKKIQYILVSGDNHRIEVVGFNAQDVTAYYGLKTRVREYLARLKLFIDLWFEVNPKFLK